MKKIKIAIIITVGVIAVFFVCASIFVKFYGKAMIQSHLSDSLKKDVQIFSLSFQFPLGLVASNVRVEGLMEAQTISLQVNLASLFSDHLKISSVAFIKPIIKLNDVKESESQSEQIVQNTSAQPTKNEANKAIKRGEDKKPSSLKVSIEQLTAEQGVLHYSKKSSEDEEFAFSLKNADLEIKNFIFPFQAQQTTFDIAAQFIKEGIPLSGSRLESSGWVDMDQKDMEAQLKIAEPDGRAQLKANVISRANVMDVRGTIKGSNFFTEQKMSEDPKSSSVDELIFGALSSMGVEIEAGFAFQTKLDDFKIRNVSFTGNVSARSIAEAFQKE